MIRLSRIILFITIILFALGGAHVQQSAATSSRYMGGQAELVTAPNGAIINKEVLTELPKTAWVNGPEIENPVEGVYVLGGYLISACIVVETEDGLIVFDTGDTKHDGEQLLKAIRTFSKKPVKAFVYLHSHYVFGTGVMAEGNKDVMVIAHPDMDKVVAQNMASGGAPAYFPEIGPVLTARALLQFNVYLPKEGPDAWYNPTNLNIGEMAYLPVTHPVKDGEILNVLGEKMQFFTKYGTDDKVHVTAWFPERKIAVENMLWNTPPNMYTTRGDVFRDAREWYEGVKVVRDLKPEVLLGAAHRPIIGEEKIQNSLNAYMDGISFVLDQTLRGILGGYGPEDLRHMVQMPDYLAEDPHNFESYGELSFQPPAIYYHAVGWYNNDAATLFRPTPKEESERLVQLIGGRDKVLAEAKAAFDRKEYAWAAQLVNYIYKLDSQDKEARLFKAKVLRQLGYLSTGANARSHLLSQALALEGKVTVQRLIPPSPEVIIRLPETFVKYFRVRIDPKKSGETDKVILFDFQGDHSTVGLHIRRAVAEYLDDPDEHYKLADVALSLSGQAWAKLYLSQATVQELVKSKEIKMKRGTVKEAEHLISLFDKYQPEKAVLVAPHLHD
jgi:alkyl sulfatase BDS1-like metallo-beta-lactamase superfamily hydrolase